MWAHLYQLWLLVWHSSFMVGAMSAFIPVMLVDYQAFKSFKSIREFEDYAWSVALWRWGQAIVIGGFGATVFRGIVGAN